MVIRERNERADDRIGWADGNERTCSEDLRERLPRDLLEHGRERTLPLDPRPVLDPSRHHG
jgi:hypothetical protein